MNVLEIPEMIGVSSDVVDRALDLFVKKNKVTVSNGHLIASQYVDSLMEEVNEMLTESGMLMVQDLTTKYGLPIEFLRESIASRIENSFP